MIQKKRPTYSDPLISVIDPHVVSLPGDGGLRVASRGDALHDSRLARGHHHVAGRLAEVVSQNWGKERGSRGTIRLWVNFFVDDTNFYSSLRTRRSANFLLTVSLLVIFSFI